MDETLEDLYREYESLMADSLGVPYMCYNFAVNEDVFTVMRFSSIGYRGKLSPFTSDIAKRTGMQENYIELIKYILCTNDHAEYGSSPRGAWLTKKGTTLYKQLKKLRKQIYWHKRLNSQILD